MDNAIVLKGISKKYTLTKERPLLLKNLFIPQKKEEMWALKDVSLEIKKGETIGIIGENGSGKSTLLKIISGITTPTSGKVEVNGRVASLIELGAGFHPDLTGKENVYLNGTLLGLTKSEIDKKYKEITEFADIGEFINQPVRTYSSGMVVRLGFSVAIHLDPKILLIDEVLAVGDEEFQRKCIQKMVKLREQKKTILLVSHNLSLIEGFAESCIFLKNGKIDQLGQPRKVIVSYLKSISMGEKKINKISNKVIKKNIAITRVSCIDKNNKETVAIDALSELKLKIGFFANIPIKDLMLGVAIYREGVYLFGTKLIIDVDEKNIKKEKYVLLSFNKHPFLNGRYNLNVGLCQYDQWDSPFDFKGNVFSFEVRKTMETINYDGWIMTDHHLEVK